MRSEERRYSEVLAIDSMFVATLIDTRTDNRWLALLPDQNRSMLC